MLNRIGQQIGNYRLIRLLGQGGFAEVYLGEHIHLNTQAAIKVLHVQVGESELEQFREEARIIAHLDHPHIVRVLDFGVEDDFPYLVMTYAPHGTLRQRHPKSERLPPTTILHYVKQLSDALQFIHDKKLVHRDIKPENMLLGSDSKLLLSDFGIAVVAHTTGSLIIQGEAGTPPYMAPEQIMKKPCPASDQYALAVVVYEWMSGNLPFTGSLGEILHHHLHTQPPRLSKRLPFISTAMDDVLLKALSKDPKERFESVTVFAESLEQAMLEEKLNTVPLRSDPSIYQENDPVLPGKLKLSRRTLMLGLSVTGLALLGGGITWFAKSGLGNPQHTLPSIPIKIGISLPLSGNLSVEGRLVKKGFDLWADDVNRSFGLLGRKIQLMYLDDEGKTLDGSNYERLIHDYHADLLLGPFDDDATVWAAIEAAKHGYALISATGSAPMIYTHGLNNLFCISVPALNYLTNFFNYILSLPISERPKTAAYVSSDDPFTDPQIEKIKAPLEQKVGIYTLYYEIYPAENTNYDVPAQHIVQSNADIVVLGTRGIADFTTCIKVFKQYRYQSKIIIGTAGPGGGSDFVHAIGKSSTEGLLMPNDAWWPTINTYQNDQFVKNYRAKYGGTPSDISSNAVKAYSAGQVLWQAVTKVNSLDNYLLIAELHSGNTFNSLQGPVKFDTAGRNTEARTYLFQWQKGVFLPVYPSVQAQVTVEYPKPDWK